MRERERVSERVFERRERERGSQVSETLMRV